MSRMFSYDDYREIIRIIKSTGLQAGYREAIARDRFVIMRHDVEYSVERAYELSKVEESMDFTSTYFSSGRTTPIISFPERTWIC